MSVAPWEAGKFYSPGDLTIPTTQPAPVSAQVTNGTFEAGDVNWTKGTGWAINTNDPFQGAWSAEFDANGNALLEMAAFAATVAGQSITLTAMVNQGATSSGNAGMRADLAWYTAADVLISTSEGNMVDSTSNGSWAASTVTAVAPATAAKVKARIYAFANGTNPLWVDNVSWDLVDAPAPANLVYRAVQPNIGKSAATEPAWPPTVGVQVIDGDVVWEAISGARIVWEAEAILLSGPTEPTWPLINDGVVADNTIVWKAVTQRVTDENCPNTTVAALGQCKIFCGDEDITRFCATNNPRDWTTPEDAGFLPTGFQQYGANGVRVLNIYRGNLVVMNSEVFQMWQIDPDPSLMAIIDQLPGIGSTQQQAAQSVGNDLLYLPPLGIRSVGIAGASTNLQAGDVGMPIDPIVQEALAAAVAAGVEPLGAYYPASGQFWLMFPSPSSELLTPIADTEIAYTLDSVNATMVGSTISYDQAANGDFVLQLPIGSYALRIVPRIFLVDGGAGNGTGAQFEWDTGAEGYQIQANEASPSGASFEPNPIDMDVVVDALPIHGGVAFIFDSESDTQYEFDVYVRGDISPGQTEVMVGDMSGGGKIKWSRYVFPFVVDAWTLLEDKLILRSGDSFVEVDVETLHDDVWDGDSWVETPFLGTVWWPWLDGGVPGKDKNVLGIDIAAVGTCTFSIGFNQANIAAFTDPLTIPADSFYEGMIPYEVVVPSFSVKLVFAGNQNWSVKSLILYTA